jgi:hypothetical protein
MWLATCGACTAASVTIGPYPVAVNSGFMGLANGFASMAKFPILEELAAFGEGW